MTEQFKLWREALKDMPVRARAVTYGLTSEQLNWRPSADRWSIGQCVDHMNRANGKILRQLEAGIAKAKEAGSIPAGDWKPGPIERLFIRMVGANAPMKSPVPPDFEPAETVAADAALADFASHHLAFVKCLDEVERSGLVRVKIASPVSKLIKCSLGSWFAATLEHDSYHLGQATQVRAELDAFIASSD